jgi:uncharacterized OB-fold protein
MDMLGAFYWRGAAEEKLLLQRCGSCGFIRFPPTILCPRCFSPEIDLIESEGRGTLWSYAVPHKPRWDWLDPGAMLAVVELDEGVRVASNLTGASLDDVFIGMGVEVWFKQVRDGIALPMFRPATVARD